MRRSDPLEKLLKRFATGGVAAGAGTDMNAIFDEVTKAVPSSVIAEGLAAAFRSNQAPGFEKMLSTLFRNSNGEQKAGLLNQLAAAIGPAVLSQVLSAAGLAGQWAGAGGKFTAELAQRVKPEIVEELAAQAAMANPSMIDTISRFYARHGELIKTLGPAALTVALAKIAERKKAA